MIMDGRSTEPVKERQWVQRKGDQLVVRSEQPGRAIRSEAAVMPGAVTQREGKEGRVRGLREEKGRSQRSEGT
jgi:hypothetical protein